jgi:carbon storage regulator
MLILARRIGESIMIGDQVEISVVDIKGDQVKLGIKAPSQVKVYRREVYAAIQAENRAAAAAPGTLPKLEDLLGSGAAPDERGQPPAAGAAPPPEEKPPEPRPPEPRPPEPKPPRPKPR